MAATASEKVSDPHNFALEAWATCGLLGLTALVGALIGYCRSAFSSWALTNKVNNATRLDETGQSVLQDWEYYLGGMAGLVLGFVLWATNRPAEQLTSGGILAALRALIWFAAFALLKGIGQNDRYQRLAISAGVGACLLNLAVSGGIFFPSVAQSLWVMAALGVPVPEKRPPQHDAVPGIVLIGVAACLGYTYVYSVYAPVMRSARYLNQAQNGIYSWRTVAEPAMARTAERQQGSREARVRTAVRYLDSHILAPLRQATEVDPRDATSWSQLATWYTEAWRLTGQAAARHDAIQAADQAVALDPEGKEGYLAKYRLNLVAARRIPAEAKTLYGFAATNLNQLVQRDPTEARLRYQLAEVLFLAGKAADAEKQAQKADELDAASREPTRRLTEAQRQQVHRWLSHGGQR